MSAATERALPATIVGPSTFSRLYGLGSIYAKTLRDSRRAFFIATSLLILFMITAGAAIAGAFGTVETRAQAAGLATALPPIFQGLLGRPVGLTTLGGFVEWRYVVLFFILMPIWSILALSSTVAAEAARGSLELVATTGLRRRRIALEKLAAHLTAVALAMVVLAITTWATGQVFATLPGDEITVEAATGYAALTTAMILLPGAIAFAAAPFLGGGAAAGLAALVMLTAYFVNGFRESIAVFDAIAPLSWFAWTFDHVPLAGLYDWPSLVLPAVLTVGLLVLGVVGFERRDMASTIRVPSPHLPGFLVGLRDPLGRSLGERIPAALAWGIGLGLYVLMLASGAEAMTELFNRLPTIQVMLNAIYPDADLESVGGMLQLVFLEFGLVIFGFAAATIVGGWASDETSGRLEVVLSNPLTRASWLIRSGLGAYLAILLGAAVVAAASAIGAASQESEVLAPALGTFVLAFYGIALAGIGIAAGGLVRPSIAAPVVILVTVGTFLVTIFARPLDLPAWVADLALSSHYGSPLLGEWDVVGIVASVILGVGGLLVGAWGLSRRDVRV
ncbi:MAG: ABC transporter permease subunit [Chloroflexi bacterium]|nr:ABC transporter permease subunit [Chloroflexota bacterium]